MTHRRIDLRIETGALSSGKSWTLAATVHLPDAPGENPPVLIGLPGGGYNRHYFDLREPGYSEAAHHVARGVAVIAIDHLRVGGSDIPALADAGLDACAEADHAALQVILGRLRDGTIAPGVAPIRPAAVVGAGQSMGGHIALLMQARHRSFDALAMLGSSVVCTRLPARVAGQEVCLLGKQDASEGLAALAGFDFRFAFHWDDVPDHFAKADVEARRGGGPMPYWGSASTPDAGDGLVPGHLASAAALIAVPTLIAMGERDVCQDGLRELAAFMSARDLALFVAPKMAHMHNFAGTREAMWRRLSAFIAQVADSAA
ncbi:MAG: lysophospholipase [Novosphingobium sp.]|nr:lysophospholipase [Novosphingobium sp.]